MAKECNKLNIAERLKEPFDIKDIQWRIITSGDKNGKVWAIVAPYLDSRAIMERLDNVVGWDRWQTQYTETMKGFLCQLTIDGITKSDGADCTDIEPTKGGISDALKRAGVPFGIGRYLYNLPTPMYADITPSGIYNSKVKNGTWVKWNPPKLPSWALPKGSKNTSNKPPQASQGTKTPPVDIFKGKMGKAFAEFSKLKTDKEYFTVLGGMGYENSDEVPVNKQEEVLQALRDKIKEMKESK